MRLVIILQAEPIAVPPLDLNSKETGAVADFLGVVRETEGEAALEGLFYEAYEPMAHRQLDRMFLELGERHGIFALTFIHRIGWVPVGEASLFLRVYTAHRAEAFAFLAAGINRLKADVPIWKRVSKVAGVGCPEVEEAG